MKNLVIIGICCGLSVAPSYAIEFYDDNIFLDIFLSFAKVLLVIFVLLIVFQCLRRIAIKSVGATRKINGETSDFGAEIKKEISDFEEEDFLAWAVDRFVKFQKSWSKGALEELHPFETEKLFEIHKMQLEELKNKGILNLVEGISVKEYDIVSFVNQSDKYEVVVHIRANMRNYFVEPNNSEQVSAFPESFNYYLLFEKQKQNKSLSLCPCCTAPINLNLSYCEYCHTNFPKAMDQWLLAKIEVQ